jgi:hypothetical protein
MRTLGSRIAALYTLTTATGLLAGAPAASGTVCGVTAMVIAGQGAHLSYALRRPPTLAAALMASLLLICPMVAIGYLFPVIGDRPTQLLLGLIICGSAAAAAPAWGSGAGLALTLWSSLWLIGVVLRAGHSLNVLLFLGALTSVLVAEIGTTTILRGFATTERALAAIDTAATGADVARARWNGQRRQIRALHDHVLSTLGLLALGSADAALRHLCTAEAAHLRDGTIAGRAPQSPYPTALVPEKLALIKHRWAARFLDVQIFGDATSVFERLTQPSAAALLAAVDQCLANVRQHAEVQVCSLLLTATSTAAFCVVLDEGKGFDIDTVGSDRLGLSESVRGRLGEFGGTLTMSSTAGVGTSVVLEMPFDHAAASP